MTGDPVTQPNELDREIDLGEFWQPPSYPATLMIDGKPVRDTIRAGRPLIAPPRPSDQVVVTPDDDIDAILEALR